MPLTVMISVLGSMNGSGFSTGRMIFAAGRDGNLPEVLSYVNVKRNTPLTSVIFTMTFGIIFIWLGNVSSLIDFVTFTSWVFYGMTFGSIIIFRFKYKDAPRPYKVPIVIPIIMVLIAIYLVIAPIIDAPDIRYLYGVIFALSASVLYVPLVHFKIKVPYIDTVTTYLQLFLEVSPPTNTREVSPPTKTD